MNRQLIPAVFGLLALSPVFAHAQSIEPVTNTDVQVIVKTGAAVAGATITLLSSDSAATCAASKTTLSLQAGSKNVVRPGGETTLAIQKGQLEAGSYLCGAITNNGGSPATIALSAIQVSPPSAASDKGYANGSFDYLLLGGFEQSDLSAQSSVSQGFYDLTMRENFGANKGSLWFRSRYLGTPSSSSKQNIVTAASNPTGTLTAANLPQSVAAVDYTVGYGIRDFSVGRTPGQVTLTPIFGIGATTPLSATTIVDGFAVPAYGTNECNQLQQRFTAAGGYTPALPPSGVYDAKGDIGCVVVPNPASTGAAPLPGTQIKDIGFSNEDRSSFLIKWSAGVRLMDRWFVKENDPTTHCDSAGGCSRLIADFTIGQDQAITGGFLRKFVLKADAIVPIHSSGFYFFAASSNRLERNATLSPLILSPVTLATNTANTTCTASSTTVCYPSPNVFILPYKQQNRDYYRIGIGIDARQVLVKLLGNKNNQSSNGAAQQNAQP